MNVIAVMLNVSAINTNQITAILNTLAANLNGIVTI
jgi:hypothetical protein